MCLLIGVASALVGLLPWVVTGLRSPVQNLWAADTLSPQMPRILLPFSQYAITLIIGVLVTGGGVAGLWARTTRPRLARRGVPLILGGVLVVHVAALIQTTVVIRAGLQDRREANLYLAALVAVASLSIFVGALVAVLIASAPPAAAVVGLSIAALAVAPWLSGLLVPFGTISPSPVTLQLLGLSRWVPAILIGAAIAWGGINTVGRVLAAVTALLLLWVVPALTTAISSSAGSRVLAHHPIEMVQYGAEVLRAAALTPALVAPPIAVALVIAALGLLLRRSIHRAHQAALVD